MTTAETLGGFDTGRVVSRAIGVLRRNLLGFLSLSALLVGVPGVALAYLNTRVADQNSPTDISPETWGFWGASMVVALFGGILLKGAVTHGALADLGGKPAPFGENVSRGLDDSLMLLALGVLTTLGIMVGLVLLVIPGVMLAMVWSMVIPVRVSERLNVLDSIARSRELTRGRRGEIFGLAAVYSIAQAVIAWLAGLVATALGNEPFALLIQPAIEVVAGVIGAVGIVSIYCELRWSQEGAPADSLAAVFD
ncbi:hypothetical protein family (UPF0259) [Caulobacter sp. AP07]|uniref:hypothetical protein n=1 Tax=Caulobacter sp. AP07 TaxID=1144304 RepID=UPI000271F81A|nr:hypothetical protein [Caulobacter sp. AP07]EJL23008.1 hypothetical protein family (UPF0259) [Caulobacter sp. AP07]